ncbi:MAG: hypothetical protein KDD35_08015 [Bdellovibrionales bacterium]|nr:hypothetical protein [Bdellovibrionales bacterium]
MTNKYVIFTAVVMVFKLVLFISWSKACWAQNANSRLYQTIHPEDQKRLDLSPDTAFLNPQAFALGAGDIKAFKLRVCTDWVSPSQAYIPHVNDPIAKDNSGKTPLPYLVKTRTQSQHYQQFYQEGFCRRFEVVTVPTSETVLKSIHLLTQQGDINMYDSLLKIDLDLDKRLSDIASSATLEKMRQDMEVKIKSEILNGPLIEQITQKVYEEVKIELENYSKPN